jgi:hypothetical protein
MVRTDTGTDTFNLRSYSLRGDGLQLAFRSILSSRGEPRSACRVRPANRHLVAWTTLKFWLLLKLQTEKLALPVEWHHDCEISPCMPHLIAACVCTECQIRPLRQIL